MPCIVLRSGRDIGGTSGLLISLYPSIRRKRVERKKKSEKPGVRAKKMKKFMSAINLNLAIKYEYIST